ncbi:hypothetical protein [Parabacteroides sp. PF5-6]|uniref:hypothetical protein n=1 Tax=Parabacteroides sp. PF5-6 TaxID=1742403 RepID=UPI002405B320|nr:hypothetical protein [Parabacteroides sp. PF5-6]MDF9830906.1 hypothetical protein [Parabacteroides sp. PF5-6]
MKEKFYLLWLSALALLVFTGAAKAETVDYTLYFGNGDDDWSLYTDEDLSERYNGNIGNWQASENTLELSGFNFTTSAPLALQMPNGSSLVLNESTENTIESTTNTGIKTLGILTITGAGSLHVIAADVANSVAIYFQGKLTIAGGAHLIAETKGTTFRGYGLWGNSGIEIKDGSKLEASAGLRGIHHTGQLVIDSYSTVLAQGKINAIHGSTLPDPANTAIYASVNYDGSGATTENITCNGTYKVDSDVAKYVLIAPNIEDGLKTLAKNYIVDSQEGLAELADIVNGTGDYTEGANALAGYSFTMMADIALTGLTGTGWTPIGTSGDPFSGTFDGNGHTISGLWINDANANAGFFGYIFQATVKNLGLELGADGIRGGLVGGLASLCAYSTVNNCYVSGTVEATSDLGGLLMANVLHSTISNCYVEGSIKGSQIGGLICFLSNSQLSNCYAACEVNAGSYGGGLIATLSGDEANVENNLVISSSITASVQISRIIYATYDNVRLANNHAWVGNIPDGTGETFAHDGLNGANWSGDMTDQPIKDWNKEGEDPIWIIDLTGETMPKLAVFGDNQPTVLNPKYQPETPGTGITHTIQLEVAEGIDLYNMTAGNHTVAEDDHLFLQFLPEDRALGAADILFLIDGIETAFTATESGNYYSYILNPVEADHTILIALREYPVTLPEVEGVTYNVGAGTHRVPYGETFTFSLTLADGIDPEKVHVFANGREIQPDALRAAVLTYTIDKVITSITVMIEGTNPTSNGDIAKGDITLSIVNCQLSIVNSGPAVDVAVYEITGQTVVQLRALRGSKTLTLQPGIYLVKAGSQTFKIRING